MILKLCREKSFLMSLGNQCDIKMTVKFLNITLWQLVKLIERRSKRVEINLASCQIEPYYRPFGRFLSSLFGKQTPLYDDRDTGGLACAKSPTA